MRLNRRTFLKAVGATSFTALTPTALAQKGERPTSARRRVSCADRTVGGN